MMYSVSSPNRLGLRAMMLYLNATTEPSCWPVGGACSLLLVLDGTITAQFHAPLLLLIHERFRRRRAQEPHDMDPRLLRTFRRALRIRPATGAEHLVVTGQRLDNVPQRWAEIKSAPN